MVEIEESHDAIKRIRSGKVGFNPLLPKQTATSVDHMIERRWTRNQTASLGDEIIFDLPKNGHLRNVYLKLTLAKTGTASMSDYPGAAVIDQVEFESGANNILKYNYHGAFAVYREHLENGLRRDNLYQAVGDTGANNPTTAGNIDVTVPIFLPTDPIFTKNSHKQFFHLQDLKSEPQLKIKLRPESQVIKSGATGAAIVGNPQLVIKYFNTGPQLAKSIKSNDGKISMLAQNVFDLQSRVESDLLPTGTEVEYDLKKFSGNLKALYIEAIDNTQYTANEYFSTVELDSVSWDVGSSENIIFSTKEEGKLLQLYENEEGFDSNGPVYRIHFGYGNTEDHTHDYDGIYANEQTTFKLKLKQSAVANCRVRLTGIVSAKYIYRGGDVVRARK